MHILYRIILYINYFILVYGIGVFVVYFIQLFGAGRSLINQQDRQQYSDYKRYLNSENMLPVSILVPSYNEEATIADNVKNLLNQQFPEYEVIVINDGSNDKTMAILKKEFELVSIKHPFREELKTEKIKKVYRSRLYPNLVVADKKNGGKADALNAGINISQYPIFISMDADSLLEPDALIRITAPFELNNKVIAAGGVIRVSSGCLIENGYMKEVRIPKNNLAKLQNVEYLRAFFSGRMGADAKGMLLIISGAFGAFKKDAVVLAGGYKKNCIGEDMELVVRLHKTMLNQKIPYEIMFLTDPVCWTQPPESLKDLYKQRKRWQAGMVDTLISHRDMNFNRDYGKIGTITIPLYWIFGVFGPVIETMGYIALPLACILGIVDYEYMAVSFLVLFLMGIILSIGAIMMECYTSGKYAKRSQILRLVLISLLEGIGYREYVTVVRMIGTVSYRKHKSSWGTMERKGFGQK